MVVGSFVSVVVNAHNPEKDGLHVRNNNYLGIDVSTILAAF